VTIRVSSLKGKEKLFFAFVTGTRFTNSKKGQSSGRAEVLETKFRDGNRFSLNQQSIVVGSVAG
jgi:hypothetical protein